MHYKKQKYKRPVLFCEGDSTYYNQDLCLLHFKYNIPHFSFMLIVEICTFSGDCEEYELSKLLEYNERENVSKIMIMLSALKREKLIFVKYKIIDGEVVKFLSINRDKIYKE